MDTLKTFNSMNSDIARLYQSNKEYILAKNLRPVTTLGNSNGALVNIKGNKCNITFPLLRKVYKLTLTKVFSGTTFQPGVVTISINTGTTVTTSNITSSEGSTVRDINAFLQTLTGYYQSGSTTYKFNSQYNENYLYIYQAPEYIGCASSTSYNPTVTITQISGSSTISFVKADNSITTVSTEFIPAQTNPLVILGSTYINDNIYLFTCGDTNTDNLGQIWELKYNESTDVNTLKLLYNNYINLSTNFPIPPTATVGRFELPSLQRIYWSDTNNYIRSLNVVDLNTFATEPSILNMRSSILMSIPVLNSINDGGAIHNISTGSNYQCAYRLSKFNGAVTNYSTQSNIVTPTNVPINDLKTDSGNWASIQATTGSLNKTITWEVDGIDTSYDIIEFVIIIRKLGEPDAFKIYKYDSQSITNTSITSTFTNDTDNMIEITLEEFQIDNVTFTHCKTIEQKDNRLFYGNVKSDLGILLDEFDTRSFRFNLNSNTVKLKVNEGNTSASTFTIIDNTSYNNIDVNKDNIGLYNLDINGTVDLMYDSTAKYQKNSTIIGGTGPNISYKFGSLLLRSDQRYNTPAQPGSPGNTNEGTTQDIVGTQGFPHGYRTPGTGVNTQIENYTNLSSNQNYKFQTLKQSLALENFNGTFRTGQHNEIYRYGIVFVSKQGVRYFAKWIGDIKFPNYTDSVAPGYEGKTDLDNTCSDFRSLYQDNSGAYCNLPYIIFSVSIPDSLANLIDGYEIVRVERKESDKSIVSQGLINQVAKDGASKNLWLPASHPLQDSLNICLLDPVQNTNDPSGPGSYGYAAHNVITYHSFENLVNQNATNFANTDKILVVEKYHYTTTAALYPTSPNSHLGSFEEYYYITKFYNFIQAYNNYTNQYDVIKGYYVDTNADSPTLTNTVVTGVYHNRDKESSGSSSTCAKGSPCVVLEMNGTFNWSDYSNATIYKVTSGVAVNSNSKLLALHYKPSVLKTQYGGRTNAARSNNEYISTGAFVKVTTANTYNIKVFGGDIFHGILNIQKAIKGFNTSSPASAFHSNTFYIPSQSTYNIDARTGIHTNRDLNTDDGTLASGNDQYGTYAHHSYPNSINTYVPRPLLFNETSAYNNRICWSNVKINGETNDSWANTPVDNIYDVDGNYGPINALIALKSNLYSIQDRALALLIVNPRAIVPDTTNNKLVFGSGDTLSKHLYQALETGTKHQWSVSRSTNAITFVDSNHKKIYTFDGQNITPTSDISGQRGFVNRILHNDILNTDNPLLGIGILTTYDFTNDEFLYTFHNVDSNNLTEKYTLAYSALLNNFTSLYDFTPYIYINNTTNLYSPIYPTNNVNTKIYIHNKGNYCTFYGTTFPSSLKVSINDNPMYTKVFDNLSWSSEAYTDTSLDVSDTMNYRYNSNMINRTDNTISRIRCYNEYQNSDWIDLSTTPSDPAIGANLRKLEQGFNVQTPRNKVDYDNNPAATFSIFDPNILTKTTFGERMRDKYLIVDLEYDNSNNYRFVLNNIKASYRVSDR